MFYALCSTSFIVYLQTWLKINFIGTWYVPLFNNLIGNWFCDNSGNNPKSMEPNVLFIHEI